MKRNKDKLTFFENIYYWIWCCMPKPRENGMDPTTVASFLLNLLKTFNGIFIIFLIQIFLPSKLLKFLFGEYNWLLTIILFGILGLVLFIRDAGYDKRVNSISEKVKILTPKVKMQKMFIFILYVILSILLMFLIPSIEKT